VFAIVDRYIVVSLESYVDEGVSGRSSLNLGHLVDEGRGCTTSPRSSICLPDSRSHAGITVSFIAGANYFYRFVFTQTPTRRLVGDMLIECQRWRWSVVGEILYKLPLFPCSFLTQGIKYKILFSTKNNVNEIRCATVDLTADFEGGPRDQVRGKGSLWRAPIFITVAYFV